MLNTVRINRLRHQTEEELNLVPFLDVMIVLIPFLMFSASFAAIVSVPASLPTPVASVPKEIRPPFDLVARSTPEAIELFLNPASPDAAPTVRIPVAAGEDYDQATLDRFHQALVEIKRAHPEETRIALDAEPSTSLQRISRLLDLSRTLVPGDTGVAQAPGQKVGTLFPTVAWKGVYVP
ncbi:MAG: biopolymer transporter ExbD [Fibrobacteria bacterium]|nr:biopolymer transporter ExbD [Fibrobacteria bacterium]